MERLPLYALGSRAHYQGLNVYFNMADRLGVNVGDWKREVTTYSGSTVYVCMESFRSLGSERPSHQISLAGGQPS